MTHVNLEAIRALPVFRSLDDEQLQWLGTRGTDLTVPAGPVYVQGTRAESLFVLVSGRVVFTERVAGAEVEVSRSSLPGTCGGATEAYVDDDRGTTYQNSMRAEVPSRFFALPADGFAHFMHHWFPLAVELLERQLLVSRESRTATTQRERLLAVGSLTNGLTHELNNPAAAALAAATSLRNRVGRIRERLAVLAAGHYASDELGTLLRLQEQAVERSSHPERVGPLEAADRQDRLAEWLGDLGIQDGWDLAPTFVQVGLGREFLERVARAVGADLLEDAVRWLNYTIETELLIQEVTASTQRISALIKGVTPSGPADRASRQAADVNDLLDRTLTVFQARLRESSVTVVKDYGPDLPPVAAYPELEQVWVNLVDNALDAGGDSGTLTLRTRPRHGRVDVEVMDDGVGIPAELQGRVFEPFFSTKPVGRSTGLGLDIAARIVTDRHRGELRLRSTPGETCLVVTLPTYTSES